MTTFREYKEKVVIVDIVQITCKQIVVLLHLSRARECAVQVTVISDPGARVQFRLFT